MSASRFFYSRGCCSSWKHFLHHYWQWLRIYYSFSSSILQKEIISLLHKKWYNRDVKISLKHTEIPWLTWDDMYVIQSSNLASIGINPSLFTDSVGEFNFFKGKKNFYILRVTKYTQMQPMCNNTIKKGQI